MIDLETGCAQSAIELDEPTGPPEAMSSAL
jgi:hypothetical protein